MDATSESTTDNILQYAQKVRAAQSERMDIEDSQSVALEARLDQTLFELQGMVAEQRKALEELRKSSSRPAPRNPSADPQERLQQLRSIKASYGQLTHSKPNLPSVETLIPALLSTKVTEQKIAGLRESISESQSQLMHTQQQLEEEERNLKDNELISQKLEERIARLRQAKEERAQKTSADIADDQVRAKQAQKDYLRQEIKNHRQALNDFIDDHLAAMIAAEELGGPTVGDMQDVSTEMLEHGFSAQGKPKPAPKPSSKTNRVQMRLDRQGNLVRDPLQEGTTSQEVAAADVKELLGELIEALLGQGSSGGYITLSRDSPIARFLVRAKVAHFHPKDARRLRLIDFGRTLDD